jgi:DNA-binding NarL/FixJ family response regulator
MKRIRLFLIDDEPQVREGLRMRLGMESDFDVVGEADDAMSALAAIRTARPDVVLTDIHMPGGDGMGLVADLTAEGCSVVMVTMQDDAGTRARAAAAGAAGFVGKHEIDSALTHAIRSAADRGLTKRTAGVSVDDLTLREKDEMR